MKRCSRKLRTLRKSNFNTRMNVRALPYAINIDNIDQNNKGIKEDQTKEDQAKEEQELKEMVQEKSVTHEFVDVIRTIKDLFNPDTSRARSFEIFYSNFFFLKGFGVLLIVVMAVCNYFIHGKRFNIFKPQTIDFQVNPLIQDQSKQFALESFVFAICSVIPFWMLLLFRNGGHISMSESVKMSIKLFVLFFVLNYVLEMSGLWSVLFHYNDPNENQEEKVTETPTMSSSPTTTPSSTDSMTPQPTEGSPTYQTYVEEAKEDFGYSAASYVALVFGASILFMLISALRVHDVEPNYVWFQRDQGWSKILKTIGLFLLEMFLFGAISAIPIYLMARNRRRFSSSTNTEFWIITAKFAAIHLFLQISGTYNWWFNGVMPDTPLSSEHNENNKKGEKGDNLEEFVDELTI